MTAAPSSSPAPAQRPQILCVDDDRWVLDGLADVLGRAFTVRTAASPIDALELLAGDADGYAVVVCDMRMPGMPGSEFLRMARLRAPDAVRILLTGDADVPAAVRAVNDGQLFRFLIKPCDAKDLMRACVAALGQHRRQRQDRTLLQDTLRGCVDALSEVLALSTPAVFGRAGRARELAGELARGVGLADWWEVEVAALLQNLGAVTLPPSTAEKLYAGAPLSESEAEMVHRVPHITHQLLSRIPRLDGVLEILAGCRTAGAGEAPGAAGAPPTGAQVLRVALDYVQLEAQGSPPSVALGALRSRGIHGPGLLESLGRLVGVEPASVREIAVSELRIGMILADDARSMQDGLLLACGQRVTERLIQRLNNLGARAVREPLRVVAGPTGIRA